MHVEYQHFQDTKNAIVDKLIYHNDRYIINGDDKYMLMEIPRIDLQSKQSKEPSSAYQMYVNELNYQEELGIYIPSISIYKIVLIKNKNGIQCLYDTNNDIIKPTNDIFELLRNIIFIMESDIQILHKLTYEAKVLSTYIDFYISYKLVECIDKIIAYSWHYSYLLHNIAAFAKLFEVKLDYNYDTLYDSIRLLINNLEQTRHGTMQRMAYIDSGTSRLLTIIATIFLPTSFLIALFSMPFKNVPFRNGMRSYYIFMAMISIIFLVLIAIFHKDITFILFRLR
jgi:hypothetical protein